MKKKKDQFYEGDCALVKLILETVPQTIRKLI